MSQDCIYSQVSVQVHMQMTAPQACCALTTKQVRSVLCMKLSALHCIYVVHSVLANAGYEPHSRGWVLIHSIIHVSCNQVIS